MSDEMYPEYEGINDFIEKMFDYAKVTDPYDCDGYAIHELAVMSLRGDTDDDMQELREALRPLAKAHKSDRPYNEITLNDCRVAFDLLALEDTP